MLDFLRPELADFSGYRSHPGGELPAGLALDRLDTNESPYDLPPALKAKLSQVLSDVIESNRYPDGTHQTLKQAIVEYVNESCVAIANSTTAAITPDQISIGNGSDELIRSLLIASCLGDRGRVLVAEPTFSMYAILAKTLAIPVTTIGRSDKTFEIDLAAARATLSDDSLPPVRAIWVVHPNSPTANPLTAAELNWLRGMSNDVLVVIDEAYFEFSQRTVVGELSQRPNWVVLRTFSKAFRLAAHRVGYAIAHPDVAATLERIRLPYNLPSLTQAAAQTAMACRRDLLNVIGEVLGERERLSARLRATGALDVWDSHANFIYARPKFSIDQVTTDREARLASLAATLKAQGTLIRHTGGGLRITVGSPAENERTVDRLSQAVTS